MIDKEIETLKEIQEELNKDVYMEKNNLIRKEKWREQAQAIDNVLNELYKYKMISDRLAEKLELLIISIYHKKEILSVNINKVKEYYTKITNQ